MNKDLAGEPRVLPRRLVVITDGEDKVTDSGDRWSPRQGSGADEQDVEQCFANDHRNDLANRIRLDILGVEVKAEDYGKMQTIVDDKRVKGKYYDVKRVKELEQMLESALGLYKYSVARAQRNGPEEESLGEKTLGETFEIETRGDVKERYRVRLLGIKPAVQSDFEVQSHEAIALTVSQASGQIRLRHEPYERGQQTEDSAISRHTLNPDAAGIFDADFNPAEFYVAAHQPKIIAGVGQLGKTVEFPISIQNGNRERFSPRPAEAWVEIAPVFAASQPAGEPYRIFDLSFEPRGPVPVLDCITPDWPAEARNAQIRVWFKLTRTKPSKEVSIAELETKPGELGNMNLPGAPDARFGLQFEEMEDGCQVSVDEEHSLDSPAAEWVRVETRTPPVEIQRTYNHEGRFARHEFRFRGKSLSQIRGDKLQFTSQRDLKAGAAVTEPLRVTIHD